MPYSLNKTPIFIVFVISTFTLILFAIFHQQPVVQVGDVKIYPKDITYRDQVIQVSYPNEKRSRGQLQLEKSAINLQILENNGYHISETQIDDEIIRIDRNTKDPERLARIKEIFKNDPESYRRCFILPLLADRSIYSEFFQNSDQIHADSFRQATEFISEISDKPEDFLRIAAAKNYKILNLTISLKSGLIWENSLEAKQFSKEAKDRNGEKAILKRLKHELYKPSESGNDTEAEQWYKTVINKLEKDQITLTPINREESWLVARLVKQVSKTVCKLDVVTFQKRDYEAWFQQEKSKIKIER